MSNNILPYFFLLLTIFTLFSPPLSTGVQSPLYRKYLGASLYPLQYLCIALAVGTALFLGTITVMGLVGVLFFAGLCELHWRSPTRGLVNFLSFILVALVALALANHLVPGFHNLLLISSVRVSPTSMPLSMFLNFDKTIAAILIAVASQFIVQQKNRPFLTQTLQMTALCLVVLIPLALYTGYVYFDPKLPHSTAFWVVNNLVFVCFAEEVIFRGFIQKYLVHLASQWSISYHLPILISSVLFGTLLLGHVNGGVPMMVFATIAGLFYGYTYHRTGRIEAAILIHFLVNLCHFLLFSYPAANRLAL